MELCLYMELTTVRVSETQYSVQIYIYFGTISFVRLKSTWICGYRELVSVQQTDFTRKKQKDILVHIIFT